MTETIESLRNDNKILAQRCDNLMEINNRLHTEIEERAEVIDEDYAQSDIRARQLEIAVRRLNNIAHEINAAREELA